MRKLTSILTVTILTLLLFAGSSLASTIYSYDDDWVNWPGYNNAMGDENGSPKIDYMEVAISDDGNYMEGVSIVMKDGANYRPVFDSLFISTGGAWNSWNYFVHDGDASNTSNTSGTVPGNGLYTVSDPYTYTKVINANRVDNPNGIDAGSLTATSLPYYIDFSLNATNNRYVLSYDFTVSQAPGLVVDENDFFVAYTPYCDNDIIGGGTAVPEPTTLILFGMGFIGLAITGRKKYFSKS